MWYAGRSWLTCQQDPRRRQIWISEPVRLKQSIYWPAFGRLLSCAVMSLTLKILIASNQWRRCRFKKVSKWSLIDGISSLRRWPQAPVIWRKSWIEVTNSCFSRSCRKAFSTARRGRLHAQGASKGKGWSMGELCQSACMFLVCCSRGCSRGLPFAVGPPPLLRQLRCNEQTYFTYNHHCMLSKIRNHR